jgi:lysophospholipase
MMFPSLLVLLLALPLFVAAQSAAEAYTPSTGQCPPGFTLVRDVATSKRLPQLLSTEESAYIRNRQSKVLPNAWKSYLANVKATNVTLPQYVSKILGDGNAAHQPVVGIATSGGGLRATIFGAGVMDALDGRNPAAVRTGTGGLLQGATYLSGLSGGSWLVTSLAQSNFPSIQDLVFGSDKLSGWLTQFDLLTPSANATQNEAYVESVFEEILGKFSAGFHVTIVDLWARALSRHFITGTSVTDFFSNTSIHGAGVTFSSISTV